MLETFSRSWFFFTKNYQILAIAMAVFALVYWLLVPDALPQGMKVDSSQPEEAIKRILQEIDIVAIVIFTLVTKVCGLLFFASLFRDIVLFPERQTSQLLLSALVNMIPASVSFILAFALLSFIGALLLGLLSALWGLAVVQPMSVVVCMYLGLRLALFPQVVVQDRRIRPLFFLLESYELTKNKMLKMLFVFACMLLAVTATTIFSHISGADEGSSNLLLDLVQLVLVVHIEVFFGVVFYRMYLDATQEASDN